MAVCDYCSCEMVGDATITCSGNKVEFPDGLIMEAVPYNPNYGDENQRCRGCGIKRGGLHHPGCDMECCPKCGGQLISCGCLEEKE